MVIPGRPLFLALRKKMRGIAPRRCPVLIWSFRFCGRQLFPPVDLGRPSLGALSLLYESRAR
jgi:hypothetical protein